MTKDSEEFWVFAYGSLMWKPGFPFLSRKRAKMPGYARRFRLNSITYRGTPEAPGLVLGLDAEEGAACEGVAFLVAPEKREEVHAYLRERELVSYAYLERFLPIVLEDGAEVTAIAYVLDHAHVQYRPGLSPQEQAEVIARSHGQAGSNVEYLQNTMAHLTEMGVEDEELIEVHHHVERIQGPGPR